MLGDKAVAAVVAVKDIEAAKKFYEGTLGLKKGDVDDPSGTMYMAGAGTMIFVYPSQFAGTNQATAATWGVGEDLEAIVDDLKAKGVTFEHYDNLPDTKLEGDIHTFNEGMKAVWFKDPDGNILNLVNQM
jgi:catechol 2,3-dioxygenase-like lactoylglutathione lyase family enzyme